MTDIVELLRWCAIYGSQENAIHAMEEGAKEIDHLRAENERLEAQNRKLLTMVGQGIQIEHDLRGENERLLKTLADAIRKSSEV